MSDRISVYKSPLRRLGEFLVAALATLGAVLVWRFLLPDISPAVFVLPLFLVMVLTVQKLGSRLAERSGAPMLTAFDRDERYLSEMIPVPNLRTAWARTGLARASWSSADRRNRNGRMAG